MDNQAAVDYLVNVMQSTGFLTEIRVGAAEGLGFTGFISAREALAEVMDSDIYPTEVRVAAAKALGRAVGVAAG